MSIVTFLVGVIVSVLDPIALAGYVLIGAIFRKFWVAVFVGVAWRVLLQLAIVIPTAKAYQSELFGSVFIAALVGAFMATSITFYIFSIMRKKSVLEKSLNKKK